MRSTHGHLVEEALSRRSRGAMTPLREATLSIFQRTAIPIFRARAGKTPDSKSSEAVRFEHGTRGAILLSRRDGRTGKQVRDRLDLGADEAVIIGLE